MPYERGKKIRRRDQHPWRKYFYAASSRIKIIIKKRKNISSSFLIT